MMIIFEVGAPFQLKPGHIKNDLMRRVWWLYFAVSVYEMDLKKFIDRANDGWIKWDGASK